MKVIKGAFVLALFLGYSEAIALKSSAIDSKWIPEEDTMVQLQQPEFIDYSSHWGEDQKPDKAVTDDENELKLVGLQEKARQSITKVEDKNKQAMAMIDEALDSANRNLAQGDIGLMLA